MKDKKDCCVCECGLTCDCKCEVKIVEKIVEVEKLVEVEKIVEIEAAGGFDLSREEMKGLLSHLPSFSERAGVQSAREKLVAALKQ